MYATPEDYAAYTGQPGPADIERRLARAADRIDELLISAVYATDENDKPIEPNIALALRDATCAQAVYTLQVGDEFGVAGAFADVSIGSIKLRRGEQQGPSRYGPDAVAILHRAGLIPGYAIDSTGWWR